MPELPEVETVRAYLARTLKGRRIEAVEVRLPRLLKNRTATAFIGALTGRRIRSVTRKGKYLGVQLDDASMLLIHLRMTGTLRYLSDERPVPPSSHLIFTLDKGCLVYGDVRTFGCFWLVPQQGETGVKGYDSLGPDGNGEAFTADYLWQLLHASTRRIKTLLLDQSAVAGLGNIYADEALFLAGIRPARRCSRISRAASDRLHAAIRKVLAEGIAHGGTTIRDFVDGSGNEGKNRENLAVYGREGQPCKRCGTLITYVKQGGRGTHYCRRCQR
ncbi:bifunctional DNA-formamidopyrimidine glycosylase/DNA-(apurinic or apyrimidinic site) lyase [Megasphaera vaginalis (ex Srinivasan et al. 2021)]|uniref:Formamidopyrimidine-DNA glycosylase n=1 Tax=Megasphaera vaginalis (ex Srinivasan et al. 2021) TaxID=1111454 RepID=U7UCD7_9FIRM|nr:bifunctional DNA-formamidopyrimidine glycosylase/DNA-(apurinic or apyrimidinic site) lyase [Megasphaera vaginalis (ex Srinivasan et al. 2021)]ERT57097.1 DNA-formamidopyrimidine glycosylase [Megasphaera vaginalis (ex Srinivasan et al. 2021)]